MQGFSPMIKVILVGDSSVGKSSLVTQLVQRTFLEDQESTVGSGFVQKSFQTSNGEVELHIWDTAGQERFRSIIPLYSRGSAAALVVFSVNSPESFQNVPNWINILKDSCDETCKIYLVANKIDLGRTSVVDEALVYAKQHNYELYTTTAKAYESVEPLFSKVAEDLSHYKVVEPSPLLNDTKPVNMASKNEENSACC